MHKKSNTALETLLIIASYLVLAVIVFFIMKSVIPSEESFFKDYFVRDVGLTVNALHNVHGNFKIKYYGVNDVNLEIQEGAIAVKSLDETAPKIYSFLKDKDYKQIEAKINLNKNATLIINKDNNQIYLESENE